MVKVRVGLKANINICAIFDNDDYKWPKSAKNPPKIRTIPKAKIQSKSNFKFSEKQIISFDRAALNALFHNRL